jgi:transposase
MAKIYQKSLFSWKDVEELGDLERLQLVIEHLPDQKLISLLQRQRGQGRNDYPVTPIWNSLLAAIVYQHKSIESLRRELQRNAQLRELCGFDPLKGAKAVPSKSAYSRFIVAVLKHSPLIDEIFNNLVRQLKELLPNMGKEIAFDSKAISSFARKLGKKKGDQRGEHEADWGKKKYSGLREDGTTWEKEKSWFGFKLHLIVDANYELPLSMAVTKASQPDVVEVKKMFDKMELQHPDILRDCDIGIGDRGYDDTELNSLLWDKYHIKPVIDIRNMWKDEKTTRSFPSGPHKYKNVVHDYRGTIFCHCPKTGDLSQMAFGGFEKDRATLKYLCPALQGGIECKGSKHCKVRQGLRISLAEDRRIFTPLARSSYKRKTIYNKRSSVERVNSRIETSFGFEKHYIRGKDKMEVRCALAMCVMLGMALGRIKQNKQELMRSLVRAA